MRHLVPEIIRMYQIIEAQGKLHYNMTQQITDMVNTYEKYGGIRMKLWKKQKGYPTGITIIDNEFRDYMEILLKQIILSYGVKVAPAGNGAIRAKIHLPSIVASLEQKGIKPIFI